MEIQQFLEQTTKGAIALSELTTIAADRRAFGDDVLAAFRTQIELRSTQAQAVLDGAQQANRDTLLASEQRNYDGAIRERDSILSLQRAIEQRNLEAGLGQKPFPRRAREEAFECTSWTTRTSSPSRSMNV